MPRAGGSYVFASRALSPYLGFVASFSQWFSLSVVMGVVSFLITPFLRDIAAGAAVAGRGGDARTRRRAAGHRARRAVGGDRPQPARHQGLRAADGAADVPDRSRWGRSSSSPASATTTSTSCRRCRPAASRRSLTGMTAPLSAHAAARVGAAVRLVHRLRLDRPGRRRSPAPGPRPAAGDLHLGGRGGAVLLPVHRRRVPHRAVGVRRGRGAAPRRDRARAARRRAAAVLDGGDRVERRRWRSSRTCRRCCWASRG